MFKPKSIHALELGGTLFVPASHKDLETVLSGVKYPELRSVVIDFEDGLESAERPQAFENIQIILNNLQENKLLRFIRPQDSAMLKALLLDPNIEKIDGFILPKFDLENADTYLSLFSPFSSWKIMPSIEGKELFDTQKLQQLREILLPHQKKILCIRFGAQDMLRQLGLKQKGSLYNMLVPSQVIANIISTFKPHGFEISAPFYPNFSDIDGFMQEIQYELQNGLTSKTIIHPSQIGPLNALYGVDETVFRAAQVILNEEDGVVNIAGEMGERKTQKSWAENIILRKKVYGISRNN